MGMCVGARLWVLILFGAVIIIYEESFQTSFKVSPENFGKFCLNLLKMRNHTYNFIEFNFPRLSSFPRPHSVYSWGNRSLSHMRRTYKHSKYALYIKYEIPFFRFPRQNFKSIVIMIYHSIALCFQFSVSRFPYTPAVCGWIRVQNEMLCSSENCFSFNYHKIYMENSDEYLGVSGKQWNSFEIFSLNWLFYVFDVCERLWRC